MKEDDKEISLEELAHLEWLSVRAINICQKKGLLTFTQILAFYEKNGSFLELQNCGKKTEQELTALCKKYKEQKPELEVKGIQNIILLINELSPLKRSTLNRHIEYLFSTLNVRIQDGIKAISKTGRIKDILEMIYEPEFNFKKLPDFGYKTIKELKAFMIKISNFIIHLRTLPNEELIKDYAKLVVKTTFKDLPDNFETEFERVLDPIGKIKLFRLLSLLIESDQLFTKNEKRIISSIYSTPYDKEETLENIATDLNLTKERVRQLKSILSEEIQSHFLFISNFIPDDFVNYEIQTLSSLKIVDKSFSEKINLHEEVNFNTLFCSIILGIFLSKTHSVLGDGETINGKNKSKGKKRFKCCYLISRNLFDVFEFDLFVENIDAQLSERITETYSLHFEGFLLEFLNKEHKSMLREIAPICKTIILNEFDVVVNFEGYLVFERNTKKPISKYVLEILEANGSVMKVEDICDIINEKYPELETTEQSIRSILLREKEFFIYFGRSSTYGLKKWEFEQEDIKGGTIRDIVEEYLNEKNEPKHISDILRYVQKYRTTNERSVMTNIEAEDSNRFQFFDGEFVGLTTKTYGLETLNFKRVIGSHFSIKILAKFNGTDLEKVVEQYVCMYGYAPIQVRYLLEKKIADGYIQITTDNKIKI